MSRPDCQRVIGGTPEVCGALGSLEANAEPVEAHDQKGRRLGAVSGLFNSPRAPEERGANDRDDYPRAQR
jgi:hypothetical protein